MKNKNKNNYYNDEDQINFEKLNNFKKFNLNILNNNHSKNQIFKYSGSDEKYFNNILKTNKKGSFLNESDTRKKKKFPLHGKGNSIRNFIYTDDFSEGILKIILHGKKARSTDGFIEASQSVGSCATSCDG